MNDAAGGQLYEITYALTLSDHLAYELRLKQLLVRASRVAIIFFLLMLVIDMMIETPAGLLDLDYFILIEYAVWGSVLGVLTALLVMVIFVVLFFTNPLASSRRTIRAENETFQHSVGDFTSEMRWGVFRQMKVFKRHICFVVSRSCIFIIPRRAFSSPEQAEAFIAFAKERIAKARG